MKAWIGRLCVFVTALCAGAPMAARAQTLPSDPIALADGRVTIAGDVSASYGTADPGFFNFTDYDHSALRMLRMNVSASVKANDHFALLGDLQTENVDTIRPYAFYLRIRPWLTRPIDIQVGRIPPTFGAFARRTYVSDNPLIGYPLAYQYLTTLRADALPASADELLRKRSFGWEVTYSVGNPAEHHGVPLVSAFRWDTGVQAHVELLEGAVRATGSVTSGTVSNPRFTDDNGGRQYASRLEVRPANGLVLGTSFARGAFVADAAALSAMADNRASDFKQTAWGGDVEYSRDYILVRAETILSGWHIPTLERPAFELALRAWSTSVEGRYKIRPGWYAAARFDHLGFSTITGTRAALPWDAPVTRIEVGGGYSIERNLLLKASFQHNMRDGGRLAPGANHVAAQIVYWF